MYIKSEFFDAEVIGKYQFNLNTLSDQGYVFIPSGSEIETKATINLINQIDG